MRRSTAIRTALVSAALVASLAGAPAWAEPGPSAATTQDGFDTCFLPSASDMAAWASTSDFTAVAVYLGGVNLACVQPSLTKQWADAQLTAGWSLIPLYVGRQAPCTTQRWERIASGSAVSQGVAAAKDAAAKLQRLGLGAGSPAYLDIEGYPPSAACDAVVFRYIDGWTAELHRLGYLAGVYGSALSPIDAIGDHYPEGADPRPDDLWIARWHTPRGDEEPLLDPSQWHDRRIHQYRSGHDETHGGVTIHIDSNFVNGSVARRVTTQPGPGHAPFAHWEGFVAQQQADLGGRTGPLSARTDAVVELAAGRADPDAFVELQLRGPWFEPHVAPIARLYWAYFGRTPDLAGTAFWANRHRAGVPLRTISQRFAASNEFATKTGGLTDDQFVRRIYTEVLGRQPDSSGLAFWVSRLRTRKATRGEVMVNFSESSEYRRKTKPVVDTFLAHTGMLQRVPTSAELTAGATTSIQTTIGTIRAGAEYAERVQ